jgi:hypothetical protein
MLQRALTELVDRRYRRAARQPSRSRGRDCDQPVGIFDRQLLERQGVQHAEHRGVGADAKSERQDCGKANPGEC